MDSSSLNAHLFLRNLVDNPNCTCGQTETTAHFLLQCRNYSVIRDTTINSLNLLVPITAKLLLHGSTALTDEQNTLIFTKVQKYILNSKKFVNAKYTETTFHPSPSFYFIFMYILFSSTFAIFIVNCLLLCNVRSTLHERAIRDDVFILSSICKETDLYKLSLFPNPCRILHIVLY